MLISKKMLLVWTIILGWSVMSPAMLSVAAKKVGSFVVAAAETSAIKAPPGGRKTGLPKRPISAVAVEPDTADTDFILDKSDMAAIRAALARDRKKARDKAYNAAHREKRKTYDQAYYAAHKSEIQAAQKDYYEAHRKEKNDRQREYRAAHKAEIQAAHKAYYDAHKEEKKACNAAYRARKKAEKAALEALAGAGAPKIADV